MSDTYLPAFTEADRRNQLLDLIVRNRVGEVAILAILSMNDEPVRRAAVQLAMSPQILPDDAVDELISRGLVIELEPGLAITATARRFLDRLFGAELIASNRQGTQALEPLAAEDPKPAAARSIESDELEIIRDFNTFASIRRNVSPSMAPQAIFASLRFVPIEGAAALFQVSVSTLRGYIKLGIVRPSGRIKEGDFFNVSELERARVILRELRATGLTLKQVGERVTANVPRSR